jgi:zinc-ribbon domain
MRKVWKWVIGIVVVLVIVAVLVGGAFLLRSRFANIVSVARPNNPGFQVPGNGNGQRGLPGPFPGMRPFDNGGWGGYGMHMRGRGMMGFGWWMPFGGLIGGVFGLVFLALVVLGIIWLVNRLRKPAMVTSPAAPVVAAAPAAPLAATHPCSRCGEPVQEGWKHCPNCGKKQ